MATEYLYEVTYTHTRVVKVRAQTEAQADAAARDLMEDTILADLPRADDFAVLPLWVGVVSDSIVAIRQDEPADYAGYDFAEDDPAGRGEPVGEGV